MVGKIFLVEGCIAVIGNQFKSNFSVCFIISSAEANLGVYGRFLCATFGLHTLVLDIHCDKNDDKYQPKYICKQTNV